MTNITELKVKFSLINPIRFTQLGTNDLWTNEIPYFEWQTNYYQKFKESDNLCFQLLCNESGLTINYVVNNMVTGAEIYRTNLQATGLKYGDYYMYFYNNRILSPGYHSSQRALVQILLIIPATTGSVIIKSEYICIYPDTYSDDVIDNTRVITVKHDENDFDFMFNPMLTAPGWDMTIMLRVEGGFKSDGFLPGGKYSMYQDLQYKPVILQSQPYNTYKFTIGNNFGIPNWIADKINRFFGCSEVKIDGIQYCRNEGAKMEQVQRDSLYPAGIWVMDLLKSENPYSDEFDTISLPGGNVDFTADTTQVSADDMNRTIDQEHI